MRGSFLCDLKSLFLGMKERCSGETVLSWGSSCFHSFLLLTTSQHAFSTWLRGPLLAWNIILLKDNCLERELPMGSRSQYISEENIKWGRVRCLLTFFLTGVPPAHKDPSIPVQVQWCIPFKLWFGICVSDGGKEGALSPLFSCSHDWRDFLSFAAFLFVELPGPCLLCPSQAAKCPETRPFTSHLRMIHVLL